MSVEVLVSTMYRKDLELVDKMNIKGKATIINQFPNNEEVRELISNNVCKMYTVNEKGLSKSRNRAIELAESDICLIADDDLLYVNDYQEKLQLIYNENPMYDIIAFKVPATNVNRVKKYYKKKTKLGYIRSMKVSSFEISFNLKSIKDKGIKFDNNYGAGSGLINNGEENIFLFDCLRKGLKILYVPIELATVSHEESTWFNGYDDKFFFDKGAMFLRMSNTFSFLLIIQFAIRRHRISKENRSVLEIMKLMLKGRKYCKSGFDDFYSYQRKVENDYA